MMHRAAGSSLVLFACLAGLSGCSDGATGSTADATMDTPADMTITVDVSPLDSGADAPDGGAPDQPTDVATTDTLVDVVPVDVAPVDVVPVDVVPVDVAPVDVTTDAPLDAAPDVTFDGAVGDSSTDAAMEDRPTDATLDVAEEAFADVSLDAPVDVVSADAAADVTAETVDVHTCDSGEILCAGACIDPRTDRANCGVCDRACALGELCVSGVCTPPLPPSCAALLRGAPATPSGTYTLAPTAGVTLRVYCDMSTGRGYTFVAGRSAGASASEILGACPAGVAAFEVRSEAHADALRRYVRTLSSSGSWYWANHFAGPASSCPALANRAGWLRSATDWVDAAIRPEALAPLDFHENCLNAGAFDPVPLNDRDGYANRGCGAGCTVLYNASEQPLPGTVVCSVNDVAACTPGTEDCNGAASDGCEVRVVDDGANCGACNRRCAAGLSCAAGACVRLVNGSPVPPAPPVPTGDPVVIATGVSGPQGLVVARDGRLYVSALRAGTIVRIDPALSPPTTTVFATGLSEPAQLTFDAVGNLLVAERSAGRVSRIAFNADGTAGARATVATGFSGPWGIAYEADGSLLVSNEFGATVDRVSSAGVVTRGVISGYNAPLDLRFDVVGRLWVGQYFGTALSNGTVVHQYDATLTRQRTVSGFSGPIGIAVDDAGNAYVANWDGGTAGAGRIVRVAPDDTTTTFYRGLNGPHALAFDARGGLWVADYVTDRVLRLGGR